MTDRQFLEILAADIVRKLKRNFKTAQLKVDHEM